MRRTSGLAVLAALVLVGCGGSSWGAPPAPAVTTAVAIAAPSPTPRLATAPPTKAGLVRLLDGPVVASLTDDQIDGLGAEDCKQLRGGVDHGTMATSLSYVLSISTTDAASLMGYLAGAYCPDAVPAASAT